MKWIFIFCIFLGVSAAEPHAKKQTICLNMIVKNESQVIERCLTSVRPLIDYYVIVDTGSTDNTQEIIKRCFQGIPGEIYERSWVDFAHNRNEALSFAKEKGDYILLIDADEMLEISEDFSLGTLDKDLYFIIVRQKGIADAKRNGLIKASLQWKWTGVIHESLSCPDGESRETLKGVINVCNAHPSGASGRSGESEIAKYLKDAEILEKALEAEPNNSRYAYYLGVSYAAADNFQAAKKSFQKRAAMPSTDLHETFLALYNLAKMHLKLNEVDEALEGFFKAYLFRPTRAEPLLYIAKIYREKGNLPLGYLITKYGLTHSYPSAEELCFEYVVYDHALLIEFANCALLLGKFDEGFDACTKLLSNPNLPLEYKTQVQSNYKLAQKMLADIPNVSPELADKRDEKRR